MEQHLHVEDKIMKNLKSAEQTHWTVFNFLVKLFAFGLTLISFLCIGLSLLEFGLI